MTVKKLIQLLRKKHPKALVMLDIRVPYSDRKWQAELQEVEQENVGRSEDKFKVVWLS